MRKFKSYARGYYFLAQKKFKNRKEKEPLHLCPFLLMSLHLFMDFFIVAIFGAWQPLIPVMKKMA